MPIGPSARFFRRQQYWAIKNAGDIGPIHFTFLSGGPGFQHASKRNFQVVLDAHLSALQALRPGAAFRDIYPLRPAGSLPGFRQHLYGGKCCDDLRRGRIPGRKRHRTIDEAEAFHAVPDP
jgi:hypothetical protein